MHVLAVTVADPDVIAITALIVAVAASLPAWLTYVQRRRNDRLIDELHTWVRPNGSGTLPQMSEQILARMDSIDARLVAVERRFTAVQGSVGSVTAQVIDHETRDDQRCAELQVQVGKVAERVSDLDRDLYDVAREMAQMTARVARMRCFDQTT